MTSLSKYDLSLLIVGAALVSLAYPPFHLFFPSFVCLIPAVILIEKSNGDRLPIRRQIQYGFLFGLLTNGLLLYWMVFALWRFTPLSVLGYAGTVLLMSLLGACMFALCGWLVRTIGVSMLVAFPTLWTTMEWVQGHFGDLRFPWLGLGTSLTGFPTVVQLADTIGARGLTLLLALANTALAIAWLRRKNRSRVLKLASPVAIGVALAFTYGMWRESTLETRSLGTVVAIQPNIGYEAKWDPALRDSIFRSLLEASALADSLADPGMIVWPEVAVPGFLLWRPDWIRRISAFSHESGTPVVLGALDYDSLSVSTGISYNAAFVFDSSGNMDAYPVYRKQYLVPITERVPFLHNWTLGIRWFGSLGAGDGGEVYELPTGAFGIVICYESAFENLAREYRLDGADFLINITNDAWFGRTTTPYQHASHLIMRAIENRMGVLRAANTGVSMLVDPVGRSYERTPLEETTLTHGLLKTSDAVTLYSRLGDWVGSTALLTTFVMIAYAWWRKRSAAV